MCLPGAVLLASITSEHDESNLAHFRKLFTMDWKEFFVSLIGSILSWPVMAFFIMLLFRGSLIGLIDRMKEFAGFGAEAKFASSLNSMENRVDRVLEDQAKETNVAPARVEPWSPVKSSEPSQADNLTAFDEAELSQETLVNNPSGMIIHAWEDLVETLDNLRGPSNKSDHRFRVSPARLLSELLEETLITRDFYNAAKSLLRIRNAVAHGMIEPTVGSALTFVKRAQQLKAVVTE